MPEEVPRKKSIAQRLGCSFGGCFFLAMLVFFTPLSLPLIWVPRLWWAKRQNEAEYDRRRDRYDAIVASIAARKFDPGRIYHFEVSPDRDPATLAADPTDHERLWTENRFIRAWRDEDGKLTIWFLTRDFVHLGSYWLTYCNRPMIFLQERATPVAPNWWAVYDPKG
ncbi:MAG TPA: hypothetical protein VNM14_16140 [Planctomycetota bacterium]|jgi:hypothetical protein|nr:hypothetical protein [Planctomycetota bacterium]